jgi:hypothetical protein
MAEEVDEGAHTSAVEQQGPTGRVFVTRQA